MSCFGTYSSSVAGQTAQSFWHSYLCRTHRGLRIKCIRAKKASSTLSESLFGRYTSTYVTIVACSIPERVRTCYGRLASLITWYCCLRNLATTADQLARRSSHLHLTYICPVCAASYSVGICNQQVYLSPRLRMLLDLLAFNKRGAVYNILTGYLCELHSFRLPSRSPWIPQAAHGASCAVATVSRSMNRAVQPFVIGSISWRLEWKT
jgi:hypothetical protein